MEIPVTPHTAPRIAVLSKLSLPDGYLVAYRFGGFLEPIPQTSYERGSSK